MLCSMQKQNTYYIAYITYTALTLMTGSQEGHKVCRAPMKDMVGGAHLPVIGRCTWLNLCL